MTDLKPNLTLENNKPVEKVVEPVKTPAVEAPPAGHDKNTVRPIEVVNTDEKATPAV